MPWQGGPFGSQVTCRQENMSWIPKARKGTTGDHFETGPQHSFSMKGTRWGNAAGRTERGARVHVPSRETAQPWPA